MKSKNNKSRCSRCIVTSPTDLKKSLWAYPVHKPNFLVTDSLEILLSLMYVSLLVDEAHLPCFPISLSLTPLSAAALAPPDLRE